MKVIKRNGSETVFNECKIINAVNKANLSVPKELRISDIKINNLSEKVKKQCEALNRAVTVEEIQDMVEKELINKNAYYVAKNYITYRYSRTLARQSNTTDDKIIGILKRNNEEVKQENANKNPLRASTMRDYMAGEVSRDLTERILLPPDIVKAHKEGIIHFHDSDFFAQPITNCELLNLEDMLQNGTVITDTQIVKPKSLLTAANITTQIIAQVASNTYGGQTFTLSHLAPFVDISRQKHRKQVKKEGELINIFYTEDQINTIAEERLKKEIASAVQTIQYQLQTLLTSNGQTPFITEFMYINEVPEGRLRDDLILLIEEVLKQRIKGLPNEKGVNITPAFPKLIYVLEEDNITPGSKYYYLTELAAKCTAKRMVPDYISEKVMKLYKIDDNGDGQCYPAMGCRSFLTPYIDKDGKPKYYGRLTKLKHRVRATLNDVNV